MTCKQQPCWLTSPRCNTSISVNTSPLQSHKTHNTKTMDGEIHSYGNVAKSLLTVPTFAGKAPTLHHTNYHYLTGHGPFLVHLHKIQKADAFVSHRLWRANCWTVHSKHNPLWSIILTSLGQQLAFDLLDKIARSTQQINIQTQTTGHYPEIPGSTHICSHSPQGHTITTLM